jgi:hypothetical protein
LLAVSLISWLVREEVTTILSREISSSWAKQNPAPQIASANNNVTRFIAPFLSRT